MKATIRLTDASTSSAVLNTLATAIQDDPSLQQQIAENGILFGDLRTPEVDRLQQELAKLRYSAFTATADSVRLLVQGDVDNLLKVLFRVLRQGSELAKMLWASGLALEELPVDQAKHLKKRLESDAATVTLTEPSSPQYVVTGRVRRTDGTVFGDTGYSVRAFDVVPGLDEPVPLGSSVSLPPDGTYRISYTWESTGDRNGPNLQVQLVDPQANVVAEAGKQSAERDATLNLEVVSCQLLHQSQGRMPTSCVVPSHVPAAVIDEAADPSAGRHQDPPGPLEAGHRRAGQPLPPRPGSGGGGDAPVPYATARSREAREAIDIVSRGTGSSILPSLSIGDSGQGPI